MSGALQDVLRASLPIDLEVAAEACSVVLPAFGEAVPARFLDGAATGTGFVLGAAPHDALLTVMQCENDLVWTRCDVADVPHVRAVHGLDPGLGLIQLDLNGLRPTRVLSGIAATEAWDRVVAAARRALAHQIVGAVERMLELAVQHALDRRQFGRPIGSFQAVRHRLSDAFVANEAASAAVTLSWSSGDEILAAMLAKSLAGRAARIASTQCQQVLAGIGFTAEHSFHRYLKRVTMLDRILGSGTELPTVIGALLVERGHLPRLVEL
jgi:hypothetical protein